MTRDFDPSAEELGAEQDRDRAEDEAQAAQNRAEEEAQAEHARAAQELAASGLFAGPDPTVVDDVLASPDVTADVDPVARAQAQTEVHRIYTDILTRAPEHDVQPSLERVRQVLELLGEPQRAYPVIHIAGTNGKTSTARIAERLLRERGLRTGRFTSPHLSDVRERISIDGEPISPEDFVATWEEVAPLVELVDERSRAEGGPRLSFFEVFVVMAYAAFADAPVDVAVVETGMGGRWDATNVADGTVEVLTSISRDHERWLGHTLTEIAAEKVGILTPGSTVVSAEQVEEVAAALVAAVGDGLLSEDRLVEAGQAVRRLARNHPGPSPAQQPAAHSSPVVPTERIAETFRLSPRAGRLVAQGRTPVLVRLETGPNIAVGPGDWGPFRAARERGIPVLTVAEALTRPPTPGELLAVVGRDNHLHASSRATIDGLLARHDACLAVDMGWAHPDAGLADIATYGASPAVGDALLLTLGATS